MAPIHDTDVAEERYSKDTWRNFELWEKIEIKLRRRKKLLVIFSIFLFLLFSSVPVITQELPKWQALSLARQLASELVALQTQASTSRSPMVVEIHNGHEEVLLRVRKIEKCNAPDQEKLKDAFFERKFAAPGISFMTPEAAQAFSISNAVSHICLTPFQSAQEAEVKIIELISLIPQSDLIEKRLDRIAFILKEGDQIRVSPNK